MDGRSPHAVLGVDECASPEQIKRAFRARALHAHPDRGGRREDFEALVAAAEELLGRHRTVRRTNPGRSCVPQPSMAGLTYARTVAQTQTVTSTWSAYDSPRRPTATAAPRRRPSFDAILREELARAA